MSCLVWLAGPVEHDISFLITVLVFVSLFLSQFMHNVFPKNWFAIREVRVGSESRNWIRDTGRGSSDITASKVKSVTDPASSSRTVRQETDSKGPAGSGHSAISQVIVGGNKLGPEQMGA